MSELRQELGLIHKYAKIKTQVMKTMVADNFYQVGTEINQLWEHVPKLILKFIELKDQDI